MEQPDFLHSLIKIVSALIFLIGILWALSVAVKKTMNSNGIKSAGKQIKVIENCYLGVKKNIILVKVPGSFLVLGIAGDTISLLSRIDEEDTDIIFNDTETIEENNPLLKMTNLFKKASLE